MIRDLKGRSGRLVWIPRGPRDRSDLRRLSRQGHPARSNSEWTVGSMADVCAHAKAGLQPIGSTKARLAGSSGWHRRSSALDNQRVGRRALSIVLHAARRLTSETGHDARRPRFDRATIEAWAKSGIAPRKWEFAVRRRFR